MSPKSKKKKKTKRKQFVVQSTTVPYTRIFGRPVSLIIFRRHSHLRSVRGHSIDVASVKGVGSSFKLLAGLFDHLKHSNTLPADVHECGDTANLLLQCCKTHV